MADLKSLKLRIGSIKQTQKITKAMKMVAASKLRRAREAAENARLYSETLAEIISSQVTENNHSISTRSLIYGVEKPKTILLLVNSSDRGLCGGLNTNIVKFVKQAITDYESKKLKVKLLLIGKKANDQLKSQFKDYIIEYQLGFSSRAITYKDASEICENIVKLFRKEQIDICKIIYPFFISAIAQEPKEINLIPAEIKKSSTEKKHSLDFEYEPSKDSILDVIIPKNIATQIFQSLLETYASEQGSRMTAMDNAVNNCAELIKKLNLQYNRTRQAKITTELVEIISASESI
jgi:F-type H+-transporting ATPase subunit gamma